MFDTVISGNSTRSIARMASAIAIAGILSACAPPPNGGYNDGGRAERRAERDRWSPANLSGFWCFGNSTNEVSFQGNRRMIVAPVNRKGRAYAFEFADRGVYRQVGGQSTYRFASPDELIWRSNDNRNLRIVLTPC